MDPSAPTGIGTSVTRDTNPDLTFVRAANTTKGGVKWRNTGQNLGSDHFVIEIELPTSARHRDERDRRRQKITDWNLFRARVEEEGPAREITDIENWTSDVVRLTKDATTENNVDEDCPGMDNRLAHMLEFRRSMQKRWRGRRNNHRLRKKIATLGREIEKYSRELCTQRWHAVCNEADGQLHKGRKWKFLRHLLAETGTKGYQQHPLAQVIHAATIALGEEETRNRIDTKYLPSTPVERHGKYAGMDNPALDRDIEEWEVRAVLQSINCKSAAGLDGISNKTLRNLGDGAIASLRTYFNRCWRSRTLPKQWKTAKTVLIPKPGKPPSIKNLRPISLTSCVGKIVEHILNDRSQRYLESERLYPDTMLGFRERLSTQDAMIQLQHDILDASVPTHDNRAVLGLDLQRSFDKVKHSAILAQVSSLGMGRRSYEYIRDFLSERTITIHTGDLQLPPKKLGSTGTPQGSVISPLLFNLVLIGGDHIAVNVIEDQLIGTGLRCSPQKSELLIVPPRGRVATLRVLGMHIEASRSNKTVVDHRVTKIGAAARLIRRVLTRHNGMKERDRINAAIRKAYRTALVLLNSTSTARLLELGKL
ncbi:uncharacterized protein LOC144174936 [Haemaphysalis longicornis]